MINQNKTMVRASRPTTSIIFIGIHGYGISVEGTLSTSQNHLCSNKPPVLEDTPMTCVAFGCWCFIGTSCGGCYLLLVKATIIDTKPATEFRNWRNFSVDHQGAGEFSLVAWRFECFEDAPAARSIDNRLAHWTAGCGFGRWGNCSDLYPWLYGNLPMQGPPNMVPSPHFK